MKKIIGLLILIIALAAVSGCTQPAKTTPVTTTVTTEVTTAVPTTVVTTVEQTTAVPAANATTEVTAAATTVAANVTAPAITTTAVTAGVTRTATPSTKITVVHIANGTFSPTPLTVLPGTRITWINDDASIHSVKAAGAIAGKFNSMDIAPSAQWGYDFGENEGTFEYADGYNLNVTGIIIVKKGEPFVGMGTPSTYATSNATW